MVQHQNQCRGLWTPKFFLLISEEEEQEQLGERERERQHSGTTIVLTSSRLGKLAGHCLSQLRQLIKAFQHWYSAVEKCT